MVASKTVSTCTPKTTQGTHLFDIFGYSQHRGMGTGGHSFIRSGVFAVGGYDWSIRFYPDGFTKGKTNSEYVSVYLELLSTNAKVRASCDLRLVDQTTGSSHSVQQTEPRMFNSGDSSWYYPYTNNFMKRSEIEASAYLRDDRLTIECMVTVIKEPHVTETEPLCGIEARPSDIAKHLGKLLEEEGGFDFDVGFDVGGEAFEAHRLVLAMRSPVFKAELYGPMKEARTSSTGQRITIKDMQPAVFKALLHFIYTDSLLGMDLEEGDDDTEMIRHLLVAADRYAMDRLKLVCQSILCKNLNVETVVTTLALADQNNCDKLRDACLEFVTGSNAMDSVVKTKDYKNLKSTCPSILVDVLEKISRFFLYRSSLP